MKDRISEVTYKSQAGANITIADKRTKNCVEIQKVSHISCDAYLSTVYTVDNKQFTVSKLLKKYEKELAQFGFVRANRNTIVNLNYIDKIFKTPQRKLILKTDFEVKISRRKMYLFKDYYL